MARRIAAHANTVEPCSANLTNRTARSCGTCGCLPNSVNRRTPVKTKQTGIPIQRSIQRMAFTLVIGSDSANFIPRLRIEQYGRQKLVCKRTRTWIHRTNKRTFSPPAQGYKRSSLKKSARVQLSGDNTVSTNFFNVEAVGAQAIFSSRFAIGFDI